MNRNLALVCVLASGFTTLSGFAQAPASAAAATAPTSVAPQAVPAKIALIHFEQAAAATNEGQRSLLDLQTKYEPRRAKLEALGTEIETLTKQLQSAPATMAETERASRQRAIEVKQKQYQRDGEDAQAAYAADLQEAISKIARKLGPVVVQYVQQNGYTMLLDNTGQQGGMTVLWTLPGSDISEAIVQAYNAVSGVAAPVVSAPSASRPKTTAKPPAAK